MGQFVSGFSGGSKDDDWVPAPVDVFLTRLVLSRRLPPELVDVILDHAEYWVPFENERDETLRLEAPADSLYAISQAVEGRKERPVKRIRFKIVSKDQGWSSFPNDHGTYNNSWTWFEAGVVVPLSSDLANNVPLREITRTSTEDDTPWTQSQIFQRPEHPHHLVEIAHPLPDEPPAAHEQKRLVVQRNVHAARDFVEHVVTWDADSQGPEGEFVRRLRKGEMVGVWCRACFVGWTNVVKKVEVTLMTEW